MKTLKKAAVIPADGFGDGLIMLTAAYFLQKKGFQVSIYSKALSSMQPFLPDFSIKPVLFEDILQSDFILLQNDNTPKAKKIIALKSRLNVHVFYPDYKYSKHGKLTSKDFIFNKNIPMAENVLSACKSLLNIKETDFKPCLQLPCNLIHKKYKNRVAIHPTSNDIKKNWPVKKFVKLTQKLKSKGFSPYLLLLPSEKQQFENLGCPFKIFDNLCDLTSFIYESYYFIGNDSGPGHLASYLGIDSTIIADDRQRMNLWQPGWKKATVLTPPPKIKKMRYLRKRWHIFISTKKVLKTLKPL